MSAWHETPQFEEYRDRLVSRYLAKGAEPATDCCEHFGVIALFGGRFFFMHEPRSDRVWFLCRQCCQRNVELQLLTLDYPPAIDA